MRYSSKCIYIACWLIFTRSVYKCWVIHYWKYPTKNEWYSAITGGRANVMNFFANVSLIANLLLFSGVLVQTICDWLSRYTTANIHKDIQRHTKRFLCNNTRKSCMQIQVFLIMSSCQSAALRPVYTDMSWHFERMRRLPYPPENP